MYKYYSFNEHSKNSLENSTIYFSRFDLFNDPFECWCTEINGYPDPITDRDRYLSVIKTWGFSADRADEAIETYNTYVDEIGDIPRDMQAKLLRVLQEREVERLGSRKTISLDVRVIATTNRDLRKAVANHLFREDLFYRLNVFPLRWLPLRARAGDILPLAEHLLRRHAMDQKLVLPDLATTACQKLLAYNWPGNVRELENVMQRALILAKDQKITADEILFDTDAVYSVEDESSWDEEIDDSQSERVPGIEKLGNELRQQEHQIILDTLISCDGSRKAVAERLGISPRTLRYKLARMRDVGIDVPD